MGNTNRSWAENEARLRDEFGTAKRPGESAKELLRYSDTNRRVNEDMAQVVHGGPGGLCRADRRVQQAQGGRTDLGLDDRDY